MIRVNQNQVELTKSVKLSKKQLLKFNALPEDKRFQYALSIMGLSKTRINLESIKSAEGKHGADKLAVKGNGAVLNMFHKLLDNGDEIDHKPISRTPDSFWVGVEIECLIDGEDGDECEYCGGSGSETCYNCEGNGEVSLEDSNGHSYDVSCAVCGGDGHTDCGECDGSSSSSGAFERVRNALRKAKITCCSVRRDGSLSGEGKTGVEITVLLDASKGFKKIEDVCRVLNSLGAEVNKSCGLHVHIDQFGQDSEQALTNGRKIGRFLPILSRLVPSSRRSNSYCKLEVSAINSNCRYYAVNMTSYRKHKTIEVRLHSGSTDSNKIINWIKLLRAIVSLKSLPSESVRTFQHLIDRLKLDGETLAYFDKRFQKFNPLDETHAPNAQPETHDDEIQGEDVDESMDLVA